MRTTFPNFDDMAKEFDNLLKKNNLETSRWCEYDVYAFTQMWGSTALGFGGIGGQAMTKALTTVFYDSYNDFGAVFFDGGLAYAYKNPSGKFFEDIRLMRMESCHRSGAYR